MKGERNGASECEGEMRSEHKEKKNVVAVQPSEKNGLERKKYRMQGKTKSIGEDESERKTDVINKQSPLHPFLCLSSIPLTISIYPFHPA